MFYIKYLTMHKVHMHAGAIRYLVYGLCVCTEGNPRALASGLSPVHTHDHTITYTCSVISIWYFIFCSYHVA